MHSLKFILFRPSQNLNKVCIYIKLLIHYLHILVIYNCSLIIYIKGIHMIIINKYCIYYFFYNN